MLAHSARKLVPCDYHECAQTLSVGFHVERFGISLSEGTHRHDTCSNDDGASLMTIDSIFTSNELRLRDPHWCIMYQIHFMLPTHKYAFHSHFSHRFSRAMFVNEPVFATYLEPAVHERYI